jgi:fatty-acyl-CoA synthase
LGDVLAAAATLTGVIELADAEFGLAASAADCDFGQVPLAAFLVEGDVLYSHRGAYLNSLGEVFHNSFRPDSVYLWTLPMFHCNGWCTTWAVTAAGATHVPLRAVRPAVVWAAIDEFGVTNLCGAPTVCSIIANADEAHPLARPLNITTAGAPHSPTVIEQLERLGIWVVHVYGLTEVYGPYTICEYQPEWDRLTAAERAVKIARQGVAMVQAESARVVDSAMADVPADGTTIGEIVLRGNNVMLGYYNDADATAEAFRGGYFHTGDLAVKHADGYIEIKDRAKAFIVLRPGHEATAEEILNATRLLIAGFKVPDYVIFVADLPRTATGKIMKVTLRVS